MKILIISFSDQLGAGKAAFRVFESFNTQKFDVRLLVKEKSINQDKVISYSQIVQEGFFNKSKQILNNKLKPAYYNLKTDNDYYFFGKNDFFCDFNARKVVSNLNFQPDIIIVTWISGFLNPKQLQQLQKYSGAKILFYPMDMSLLTGGCHYAWNCEGYTRDCSICPAILDKKHSSLASRILNNKLWVRKKASNAAIMVCSEQLHLEAKKSVLFKDQFFIPKIFLPINQEVFQKMNKNECRKAFNLPLDRKIIFFGATASIERRKGFSLFLETLHLTLKKYQEVEIDPQNLLVVIAGHSSTAIEKMDFPFETRWLGYFKDDESLARLYNCCDVFVNTSIQDSGPMMINEVVSCGIPIASFKIGVASDLVQKGKNGFWVDVGDTEGLSKSIFTILSMNREELEIFSANSTNFAKENLSYTSFTNAFKKYIPDLLGI